MLEFILGLALIDLLFLSLVISIVFFCINLMINNLFFDLICGFVYCLFFSSLIGIIKKDTSLGYDFLISFIILFSLYLIITILSYVFLKKYAEQSNTINQKSFEGKIGTVITSIPNSGFGEVLLSSSMQKIATPAKIYSNVVSDFPDGIPQGTEILVINSFDSHVEVVPYTKMFT